MIADADKQRPLLTVQDLSVEFRTGGRTTRAVKGVSFEIPLGRTLGLVGESGSGKSVSSLAIMGLIPSPPGHITGGSIHFDGRPLLGMDSTEWRQLRGNDIGMIFQEPMTSLNPVYTIGNQLLEAIHTHRDLSADNANQAAREALAEVKIPDPVGCLKQYPHELSGGMRQRVMIAMALACQPKLLICDEPTTALDVTVQSEILELLQELQDTRGMSMLFITHDLGVIAQVAHRVCVMRHGEIVEQGAIVRRDGLSSFDNPQHPYTIGLYRCLPRLTGPRHRLYTIQDAEDEAAGKAAADVPPPKAEDVVDTPAAGDTRPIIEVQGLVKHFPIKGGFFKRTVGAVKAVDGVSFKVEAGRTLALVGESGCGKTTTGRSLLRLLEPSGGDVRYNGDSFLAVDGPGLREMRQCLQIVFQDPFASLNPRMTCGQVVEEGLIVHERGDRVAREARVAELLDRVGLTPEMANRYPHEFSGGQRQRIGIARALAVDPDFIVCDEAVSALDVSIQAQVINLLMDLQRDLGLAYLFISHDLAVVRHISHRVAVMFRGRIVEEADTDELFRNPLHPYTQKLLSAIPVVDPEDRAALQEVLAGKTVASLTRDEYHFDPGDHPVTHDETSVGVLRYCEPTPGHRVLCQQVGG